MSYTNKPVTWESAEKTDNYADVQYGQAVTVYARKQTKQEIVRTSDGRELLCRSIFYIDPKVTRQASQIKRLDKLDGETIENIYVMCDRQNKPKMYRFITI